MKIVNILKLTSNTDVIFNVSSPLVSIVIPTYNNFEVFFHWRVLKIKVFRL